MPNAPETPEPRTASRVVIASSWILAIVLGGMNAWYGQHVMNPDGVSYLDIADAYLRGDWQQAVNSYWGPLYSWLIAAMFWFFRPSAYAEFPAVHALNFVVLLAAMGCFHFFLREVIRLVRSRTIDSPDAPDTTFPEWAWWVLGYGVFLWATIELIPLSLVTPDLCVAATVFLASGLLVRIGRGSAGYGAHLSLGLVLGIGYLCKAIMFPVAFVYLAVALFVTRDWRRNLPRVAAAFVVLCLVAAPFIVALTKHTGRIIYSDAGRINYMYLISAFPYETWGGPVLHWQGEIPGLGTPVHPARKILADPPVYEFAHPIGGTYPAWYDPTYWCEGMIPRFNARGQEVALVRNLAEFFRLLFGVQSALVIALITLYAVGGRDRLSARVFARTAGLLIPAVLGICPYMILIFKTRYVGGFLAVLWIGLFATLRFRDAPSTQRLLAGVAVGVAALLVGQVALTNLINVAPVAIGWRGLPHREHWNVAVELERLGFQPGDPVASIGNTFAAYWARRARVQVVAEMTEENKGRLWAADPERRQQVLEAFASTPARAIITHKAPAVALEQGWKELGNTGYFLYPLDSHRTE